MTDRELAANAIAAIAASFLIFIMVVSSIGQGDHRAAIKSEVNVFAIERCDRNHIAESSRGVVRANGSSEVIRSIELRDRPALRTKWRARLNAPSSGVGGVTHRQQALLDALSMTVMAALPPLCWTEPLTAFSHQAGRCVRLTLHNLLV